MRDASEIELRPDGTLSAKPPLRFAGLVLDLDACTLARESGEAIPLTRSELAHLRLFISRPGRVLSRDAVLNTVANRRLEPFDRSVDAMVGRLRHKIEPDPKRPSIIVTVPGEGYRFDGLKKAVSSAQKPLIPVPALEDDKGRPERDAQSGEPSEQRPGRKLSAILVTDLVGYSRLAGADEDRTLVRLRGLFSDLIDPAIAAHHGRIVKRTGDGLIVEFRSVVDAVRCAIEVQTGLVERNAGLPPERRIEFRIGIHLGDVVEEADGDLMGDGVNIAARLESICERGAICLSEQAYWQVKGRLDLAVTDLGPSQLKNIAEPIRVYALEVDKPARLKLTSAPEKSAPPRLSMVVLPFANIGGDPEQEHFVDGVTESLTTDLSRIRGSFVIARNTAFVYKGKLLDAKTIGRELNVRYVLEGSVQRGGGRMRVNVQLIDAEAGSHIWAERFDKPVADLFDMQDEIVARLASQLGAALIAAEARRSEQAPNPDSMDLYFQGLAWFYRGPSPDHLAQARKSFDRAVAADPSSVDALIGSAGTHAVEAAVSPAADPFAAFAAAEAKLTTALSLAPNHPHAHMWLGLVDIWTKRAAEGIARCEHALDLDRNLAQAHSLIGYGKLFIGREEETESHIAEALRLSPRDPGAFGWMSYVGMSKSKPGSYEQAAAWFRRSIDANRNFPHAHFLLASALAHLGRLDEARSAVKSGLALNPIYTISRDRAVWTGVSDDPTYLAGLERVLEGLRKAGAPE
jgi:TolB-like protein/class 3 adenylate cyclase/Tfp pilus assembly protein PilF